MDYVEQLTYLLFLKMADERANRRLNPERIVPDELGWPSLVNKAADDLHDQYEYVLAELGRKPGMLGAIFNGAKNKIQEPAVLERLVKDLINSIAGRVRTQTSRVTPTRDCCNAVPRTARPALGSISPLAP